jgi:hypothetical protein
MRMTSVSWDDRVPVDNYYKRKREFLCIKYDGRTLPLYVWMDGAMALRYCLRSVYGPAFYEFFVTSKVLFEFALVSCQMDPDRYFA